MKKIVLSLCLGLMFTSSCFASPLNHLLSSMKKLEKTTADSSRDPDEEGYTDFSGVWVGTCDDEPDRTETLNIKMIDSSIMMDEDTYDIDAVNTKGIKNNLNFQEAVFHFRWNEDGRQLLTTFVDYSLSGYMATAKMETFIGKMIMSIENDRLITRLSGSAYFDGIHQEEFDLKRICTYSKKSS